jgi:23S rRNA pseudouridine1911/1915/1917 synthase
MVVAKRTKAAQRLTQSLQIGEITRTYLGWVIGTLEGKRLWQHLLEKKNSTNTVQVVSQGGKAATLTATPIRWGIWNHLPLTRVLFQLETGRSHQIRVQCSFEGFPLLGDVKYGHSDLFERVALHSFQIEFPHPMSRKNLQFEAPLPSDLSFLP